VNNDEWTRININALSGIRTHDLSVQAIKGFTSDRAATGTRRDVSSDFSQCAICTLNISPNSLTFSESVTNDLLSHFGIIVTNNN